MGWSCLQCAGDVFLFPVISTHFLEDWIRTKRLNLHSHVLTFQTGDDGNRIFFLGQGSVLHLCWHKIHCYNSVVTERYITVCVCLFFFCKIVTKFILFSRLSGQKTIFFFLLLIGNWRFVLAQFPRGRYHIFSSTYLCSVSGSTSTSPAAVLPVSHVPFIFRGAWVHVAFLPCCRWMICVIEKPTFAATLL